MKNEGDCALSATRASRDRELLLAWRAFPDCELARPFEDLNRPSILN
ncbi:MAG: hypothetical protein KDJ28_19295 [Candidatus Competibacteraceae bacterium]|nr:hypothetical protein [Candidatus Competibacteraceae bacterium]HRX72139.1 hypothetical protein [Candidatus Competibacteraceae bacterium]